MITSFNTFAENWMSYFGTSILQNTLFLGVIFLVLHLLRDRHAHIRYAVAALGLIKLLVPPFVPLMIRNAASAGSSIGTIEIGGVTAQLVPVVTPVQPHLSLLSILFLIWLLTALVMIASTLISTLRLNWHLRASAFVKHKNIDGKAIDIYCSPNISVPLSIGLFPKRIYVPILWCSLNDKLQHSLLRHEMAHIKRKDGLLGALQMLAMAIYFFHPLVWILTRQADELREMACDDMAVDNSEVTPLVYSRCLVHVAEHMLPSWSCTSASTLMKQKNKLYHRVNYQIKETGMKTLPKHRSRLIWTILLVLIVPLSWYCKQPDATVGLNDEKAGKIYGKVIDAETGEALVGANIIIMNTNKGAASDMKGNYVIPNVPAGKQDIVCSLIGYARTIEMGIVATENKSTKVNFTLKPEVIQGEKNTISAKDAKDQQMELTPPEVFVVYDTPPEPVGGFQVIAQTIKYPESAGRAGLDGKVIVRIYINESGDVTQYEFKEHYLTFYASQNNTTFDGHKKELRDCKQAAIDGLSSLKWVPAMVDNHPVAVWITIPIEFSFPNKQEAIQKNIENKKTETKFVPHDITPVPIGGQAAIAKNVHYPELAKKAGIEGTVIVQAKIGLDGTVTEAIVLKGVPDTELDEAALTAVKKTRWIPAKEGDKDVSVWITLPIQFNLDDKNKK
ncbi:MAG: TonB family protein [Candidatus Marinimicrobia bacterium]|nr:TonB family protein [Candidatus Neomarinimicrobiota bacterium]